MSCDLCVHSTPALFLDAPAMRHWTEFRVRSAYPYRLVNVPGQGDDLLYLPRSTAVHKTVSNQQPQVVNMDMEIILACE